MLNSKVKLYWLWLFLEKIVEINHLIAKWKYGNEKINCLKGYSNLRIKC